MTTPLKLTDEQLVQFLRSRALEPPPGLLGGIVDQAAAAPQTRRWFGLRLEPMPPRGMSGRSLAILFAAVALLVVSLTGALIVGSGLLPSPAPEPPEGSGDWTGPVRTEGGEVVLQPLIHSTTTGLWTGSDPNDSTPGWVDVVSVGVPDPAESSQPHWYITLAAPPPQAADLEPSETLAYGLVFETTGDSVADFEIGIENAAFQSNDFRVWVTNLATGVTSEQVGPPYGVPVEFSHPNESGGTEMVFTFLGGTSPPGLVAETTRFYAWASSTVGGEVVAWDYAPDTAWLTLACTDAQPQQCEGEPSASQLPRLGMPGTVAAAAGDYGFERGPGSSVWMHNVGGFGEVQMLFALEDDCFASGENPEPTPVTVAGFDGLQVEPYVDESLSLFDHPSTPEDDVEAISAYQLAIDGRTLCVYLGWSAATPPEQLDSARQVLETIRGQSLERGAFRINFTLPQGWDTG
jgi:hypothetical protein